VPSTQTNGADDIRREMAEIRSHLHTGMSHVVGAATTATDWKAWVQGKPWISLGLAFVAGYVAVPRKREDPPATVFVASPPTGQAVEPQGRKKPLLLRALGLTGGLVGPLLMRLAQAHAQNWLESQMMGQGGGPLAGLGPGGDGGGAPRGAQAGAYDPRYR
jgi:hypothetical protein